MNEKKLDFTKIFGGIALLSTVIYLIAAAKEKNATINSAVDGLTVDIDADKLIDSGRKYIQRLNPQAQNLLANAMKGIVKGYIDGRE